MSQLTIPRRNLSSFVDTPYHRLSVFEAADWELGLWLVPANADGFAFDANAGLMTTKTVGLNAGRAGGRARGCVGCARQGGRLDVWLPSNLQASRTDADLHLRDCFRGAERPTCPGDIEPIFLRQPFERSCFDFETCLGT